MKTQIRGSVFETNSSSTHAICIGDTYVHPDVDPNEVSVVFSRDFGWESDTYAGDAIFSYLYTLAIDYNDVENFTNTARAYLEEIGEKVDFDEKYYDYGIGIDHPWEARDFYDWALSSKENFYRCVHSMDTFIITGNDNGPSVSMVKEKYNNWNGVKFYKGN